MGMSLPRVQNLEEDGDGGSAALTNEMLHAGNSFGLTQSDVSQ